MDKPLLSCARPKNDEAFKEEVGFVGVVDFVDEVVVDRMVVAFEVDVEVAADLEEAAQVDRLPLMVRPVNTEDDRLD